MKKKTSVTRMARRREAVRPQGRETSRRKVSPSRRKAPKGPHQKKVLRSKNAKSLMPVDLKTARERFMEIWSDPMDHREEADISEELRVEPSVLRQWRLDPQFYVPATEKYKRALQADIIAIHKNLRRQALEYKSLGATRTLLEMYGLIEGKGTKVNVLNMGGTGGGQDLSHLSDPELDSEIERLFTETSPKEDCYRRRRKEALDRRPEGEESTATAPDRELVEAEYEVVNPAGRAVGDRGMDSSVEEGEALQPPSGEAEKAVR